MNSNGGKPSKSRAKETSNNQTWEQMVEREPLIAFSWYLSGRVNVLLSISHEIIDCLDRGFTGRTIDGSLVERAESLMWLWILGAYEVVRTICQARGCFSEHAAAEFARLKIILTSVRIPAAKMEKPGKKQTPVSSDRSPSGWDIVAKDLLVNDPTDATVPIVSARSLLAEFERVMSSLTNADVLDRHEATYLGWLKSQTHDSEENG